MVKRDLGRVLLACEEPAERPDRGPAPQAEPEAMSDDDAGRGTGLAPRPGLADRIAADFARIGMVGERTTAWSATSPRHPRKLPSSRWR